MHIVHKFQMHGRGLTYIGKSRGTVEMCLLVVAPYVGGQKTEEPDSGGDPCEEGAVCEHQGGDGQNEQKKTAGEDA